MMNRYTVTMNALFKDTKLLTPTPSRNTRTLRPLLPFALPAILLCTLSGCINDPPCTSTDSAPPAKHTNAALFVDSTSPFDAGPLTVNTMVIDRCDRGAPASLRIHAPQAGNASYAVVVFQHGFQAMNSAYDDILSHLASHGFVVVAPQMYQPGLSSLFGRPSAAEEAVLAATVLDWLPAHLSDVAGVTADTSRIGLAGHSRGGKVAWLVLKSDATRAMAVAGVDPVDGQGGPLGGQARVVDGMFQFSLPALILGTGLGGGCAPENDNHVQFYQASMAPAWHIVAEDYGHADMLNEEAASAASLVCKSGTEREKMRSLTAGLLVSLFRGALQGDKSAYNALGNAGGAPARITVESK